MEEIKVKVPKRVELKLFTKIDSKPVILGGTFDEVVGSEYYKITVEVRETYLKYNKMRYSTIHSLLCGVDHSVHLTPS